MGTDVNFSSDTSFNTKYEAVDDPSYFLANVADIFKNDDLTVVNMEGTLTTSSTRQDKTFAFKGPADYAQILVKGNVETASLANNHSRDYGEQSYTDTISALENAGIGTFGYDRIDYREVNGVKVALIGTYELAKHPTSKTSSSKTSKPPRKTELSLLPSISIGAPKRKQSPMKRKFSWGTLPLTREPILLSDPTLT